MSQWYVYILKCADGTLYCGSTTDVKRRVLEHNGVGPKGAKYTKVRRPVVLMYTEPCLTRSDAGKREWEIKHLKRNEKQKMFDGKRE